MPIVAASAIVVAVVALLAAIYTIVVYNRLVGLRNHCDEAWSNVDTELQRRYELIPNLVSTVKGYAAHERRLLTELTRLRERATHHEGPTADHAEAEARLEVVLDRLLARVEAYPDLKADRHFLQLQRQLTTTANRIQAALRFYNGNVRETNNLVDRIPSNLVASLTGFGRRHYFEPSDPAARARVQVDL